MNIQITDNYRITSDKLNIILQEKYEKRDGKGKNATPTGEFNYQNVGYFGNLDHLVKRLVEKEIYNSDAESLHSVVDQIDELTKQMQKHLTDKVVLSTEKGDE